MNFNTDRVGGEAVAERIREMGRESVAIQADVSVADQVEAMIETVEKRFGARFDILVNNAGIGMRTPVIHMTDNEWDQIIDTNLKGAFLVSRAFANKMIEKGTGGRIIGIASGAGHSGRPAHAHYCASKAGLIGATKALAKELAPQICVNSIAPGVIERDGEFDGDRRQLSFIPAGRFGRPEDVTRAVIFLLENDYITGQVMNIDGGRCI